MKNHIYFLTVLFALVSCQSISLNPEPPAGFDLTGIWKLDVGLSDPPPLAKGEKKKPRMRNPNTRRERGSSRGRSPGVNAPLAFVTQDFPVLASRRMKIEQNHDSLGVEYDRGGYRDVSWGDRDRGYWQVRAGWEGNVLIIFSKANDQVVVERHELNASGQVLTVTVDYHDSAKDLNVTRVFNKRVNVK